jgi:hypothetical protein
LLRRLTAKVKEMPRLNSSETTGHKEQPPTSPPYQPPLLMNKSWRGRRKRILKRIGLPTTLYGLAVIFFSFFPHLNLSEPLPMDETQFFSKSLTITNDGVLPVFGVRCGVGWGKIRTIYNNGIEGPTDRSAHLMFEPCHSPTLSPGDAYSFTLEKAYDVKMSDVTEADFDIVISYIPLLPPIRMDKCTHFVVYKDNTGKQHWFRSPGQCAKFPWLVSNKIGPRNFVE